MKLIGCGDSWAWGAELVDPVEEPIPLFKLEGGGYQRQFKPVNVAYREKHRYLGILSEYYNAELIDLSAAGISNDTIYRQLFDYLIQNDYLEGRDTSDLFISIGFTSPERTEFFYEKRWGGDNFAMFGPWSMDQNYDDPELSTFFNLYYKYFSHAVEYMRRYIQTIYNLELLLKKHNIKYIMHQAFYHHIHKMINQWDDEIYLRVNLNKITTADKRLYALVDPIRFVNKNEEHGTAHHYMLQQANGEHSKVFNTFHPNVYGHKLWAEYLINYIDKNNLL